MAGLVPERRDRSDIQKANDRLLKDHNAYLKSWIEQSQKRDSLPPRPSRVEKKPDDKPR